MWRASGEAGVSPVDGRAWTRVSAMVFDDALLLTREMDQQQLGQSSTRIVVVHEPIFHKDILSSDFLENGS